MFTLMVNLDVVEDFEKCSLSNRHPIINKFEIL